MAQAQLKDMLIVMSNILYKASVQSLIEKQDDRQIDQLQLGVSGPSGPVAQQTSLRAVPVLCVFTACIGLNQAVDKSYFA